MPIIKDILKAIIGWFIAVLIIALIVWVPMEISYDRTEYEIHPTYEFSTEKFSKNLSNYFSMVFFEQSLGNTRFGQPISEELKIRAGRSFIIIGIAFLFALLLGTLKGFFDYRIKDTKWNFFGNHTTFFFQSLPDFFIVIVVQVIILNLMDYGFPSIKIYGVESWHSFLLAGYLLSIFPTVYMARIVYSSLIKEEGNAYLATARSKGLSVFGTLWKHQFANSIFQVIPHVPTIMLYILSNLLIVEYLMDFKGAGQRLYEALGFAGATIIGGINRSPFNINVYEPELVIAISAVFIGVVALIQLACKIFIYFAPVLNGGSDNE